MIKLLEWVDRIITFRIQNPNDEIDFVSVKQAMQDYFPRKDDLCQVGDNNELRNATGCMDNKGRPTFYAKGEDSTTLNARNTKTYTSYIPVCWNCGKPIESNCECGPKYRDPVAHLEQYYKVDDEEVKQLAASVLSRVLM